MHPRLGYVLVLGALLLTLVGGAVAQVDSEARIVRLSYVDGSVQLDRDDTPGSGAAAFLNSPVTGGSRLTTGADGFAETEFETGGTVRVTPNTDLRFRELGLRDGHKITLLEMSDGTAYFNVKKDSDDDFRILVAGNELRVPKSSRFRIHVQPQSAQIAVMKGELQLVAPDNNVRIKKDEQLLLDFQDPGRYFLGRQIDALSYDSWDRERDDYRDRYQVASNNYHGYSPGYMYGVSDLNYYGNYVYVPGYGYAWRPYGYDISWDPFMDGAWVWYPGWGYMWVSAYPWGWMPYRYGRWIWASGYGWLWQPGNRWHRWYTCNTVYNPPPHYHRVEPPPYTPPHGGRGGDDRHRAAIVPIGKGPYAGNGSDPSRFRRDPEPDQPVAVNSHPGGAVRQGPSALTPGVQPSGVLVELRRVHGDDLGGRHVDRDEQVRRVPTVVPGTGVNETGAPSSGIMTPAQPVPAQQPVPARQGAVVTPHPAATVVPAQPQQPALVQTVHPEPRVQPVQPSAPAVVTPRPAQSSPTPPSSAQRGGSSGYSGGGSSYRSNSSGSGGSGGSSYHSQTSGGSSTGSSGGSRSSGGGSSSGGQSSSGSNSSHSNSSTHESPK
ncbi:MAG TPA: DUF6600 domain-containing protein [Terriglobales bacterium]|nr:DUF6600 domain-containing protein [Terriglobales bacterium]